MNGRGSFQVTEVGDATEIGKVSRASTEITSVKTPLNLQLDKLAKLISKFGIGISVAAFVIFLGRDIIVDAEGIWHSTDYLKMAEVVLKYFMMAVTLIVMAVPEGMPMAVTLSLALNMRRMLKNNNLVRKLHACETMGAVTVICTDKTGTLTQNKMQVAEMQQYDTDDALFRSSIALNTTAHLDAEGGKGIGNPTEIALLLWLEKAGVDYKELRKDEYMEAQLPFSTERKYMATVGKAGGKRVLMVKGAPEIIMSMCDIDDTARAEITNRLRGYQNQAMRTLAFAYRTLDGGEQPDMAAIAAGPKLTFQAVTAISDPIRPDVPDAVKQCISAGIQVKIVTGDTSATAIEIARQIGIWDKETPAEAQITGPDFAALSDEDAFNLVPKLRVMSRARPTDKQRLVNLLQKHGAVVAVTGDGTNDAPALHHAHVGLSLGSGTSVAKEASDMTLIDDSFRQHSKRRDVGALALPQHPALPLLPVGGQRHRASARPGRFVHRNGAAAHRHPDTLGQPHNGHLRCSCAGVAASFARSDEGKAAQADRLHHNEGHGPWHHRHRTGILRRAVRLPHTLQPAGRRPASARAVAVLHHVCDAPVLELV